MEELENGGKGGKRDVFESDFSAKVLKIGKIEKECDGKILVLS